MSKFPGWRNMTGVQRRNAKMGAMFERSYELKARAAGWTFDEPANEYRLNDTGEGYDAIDANKSWRELCLFWDIS